MRGKPRNVVARLRLEQLSESVPQTAVVAGALSITNNGNHGGTPIIDATGSQVDRPLPDPDGLELRELPEPARSRPARRKSDADEPDPDGRRAAPALQAARDHGRQLLLGLPGENGQGYDLSGKVVWVEGCTSPPNLTSKVADRRVRPGACRPGSTPTASTRRPRRAC